MPLLKRNRRKDRNTAQSIPSVSNFSHELQQLQQQIDEASKETDRSISKLEQMELDTLRQRDEKQEHAQHQKEKQPPRGSAAQGLTQKKSPMRSMKHKAGGGGASPAPAKEASPNSSKSHHSRLVRESSVPKFEKSRSLTDMGQMFQMIQQKNVEQMHLDQPNITQLARESSFTHAQGLATPVHLSNPESVSQPSEYQNIVGFVSPPKQIPKLHIPQPTPVRSNGASQSSQLEHDSTFKPLNETVTESPVYTKKKRRARPRSAMSSSRDKKESKKLSVSSSHRKASAPESLTGGSSKTRTKRLTKRASSAMRTQDVVRSPHRGGQRASSVAKMNSSRRLPSSRTRTARTARSTVSSAVSSPRIIEISRSRAFYFESKKRTPVEKAREEAAALLEKYNALGPFISNLLSQLPEDSLDGVTRKILSQSRYAASIHMNRWYDVIVRQMLNCGICPQDVSDEELCFVDVINNKMEHMIRENFHHQISLYHCVEPKAFIAGPRESGKTTLLYLLTKLVAEKFLYFTGQFQSVFFVSVNWEQFMRKDMDVETFYQKWIKLVIDALCAQRLPCSPHKSLLYNYFMRLTRQKRITTQFTAEFLEVFEAQSMLLTILAEKILHAFNSDKHEFMNVATHFAKTISEMFYFDRCIFVFDNFDYTYRYIHDGPTNSKVSTEKISVYLKDVMKYEYYLLSGQETATFLTSLQDQSNVNRGDVDLLKSGTMVRTDGLVTSEEASQLLPTTVTTFDPSRLREGAQKTVDISVFGGAPAYLAHVSRFIGAPRQYLSFVPEQTSDSVTMSVDVVNSLHRNVTNHQIMIGRIGNEYQVASDVGIVESLGMVGNQQ